MCYKTLEKSYIIHTFVVTGQVYEFSSLPEPLMLRLTSLASLVLLVAILVSLVAILVSLVACMSLPAETVAVLAAIFAMLIPLTAVEISHACVYPCASRENGCPALAGMTIRGCVVRCILGLSCRCYIWRGKLSYSKAQSREND